MNQLSLTCSLLPKNHIQNKSDYNRLIIDYGAPIISDDRLSISSDCPSLHVSELLLWIY